MQVRTTENQLWVTWLHWRQIIEPSKPALVLHGSLNLSSVGEGDRQMNRLRKDLQHEWTHDRQYPQTMQLALWIPTKEPFDVWILCVHNYYTDSRPSHKISLTNTSTKQQRHHCTRIQSRNNPRCQPPFHHQQTIKMPFTHRSSHLSCREG